MLLSVTKKKKKTKRHRDLFLPRRAMAHCVSARVCPRRLGHDGCLCASSARIPKPSRAPRLLFLLPLPSLRAGRAPAGARSLRFPWFCAWPAQLTRKGKTYIVSMRSIFFFENALCKPSQCFLLHYLGGWFRNPRLENDQEDIRSSTSFSTSHTINEPFPQMKSQPFNTVP